MCIAIPMQVKTLQGSFAICEGRGEIRRLNMMLLGKVELGSWVLAHLDWAKENIDEIRASQINDALDALDAVMRGESDLSSAFADLTGREPLLPDFLRGKP